MNVTEIKERVARGVAWLDANWFGWVNDIDLTALDLNDCELCVLGQLDGNFDHAVQSVWVVDPSFDAVDCGFDLDVPPSPPDLSYPLTLADPEFRALTDEWRRVITEFRALTDEWRRVITERRLVVRQPVTRDVD